ncbi:Cytochrome c oxidase subunit 2 precursor [Dermatophilus congolensis]|uniref:Cytochrome c oxidase subunit 2 n=2 Tax=Dermatophilus congolensis TaxID=1863 RepID=A0AA46BND3_9MICO|nr:Cytochrome c oxidase subunit 2 precursor [Dermatophilus congolensis]
MDLDGRCTLRTQQLTPTRSRARRLTTAVGTLGLLMVALTACGKGDISTGWLPYGATTGAQRVTQLWIGMWIAALAVGALVWGLTIYCMIRFRRKKDDVGLPPQLRYNVPIEMLYTVIPVMMVGVMFYFVYQDERVLSDTSQKPDVVINVAGKQWSWDFNYMDSNVHDSGVQADLTGKDGVSKTLPTLYLPVNKRVEFTLTSRDVIHSFWVPAFQQKLDMVPGNVNKFQVTPTQVGTFQGKCAELCGAYHATMLFNVKVVPQAEYDAHIEKLRAAGNTGILGTDLNRHPMAPNQPSINGRD